MTRIDLPPDLDPDLSPDLEPDPELGPDAGVESNPGQDGSGSRDAAPAGERALLGPLAPRAAARFVWTQLTSMRTALVLLFTLAVAAIPGSLIPQRKVTPVAVSDFIRQHRVLGPFYDRIGMFHVFTSPWFSAVYLLLFVSLVGCIVPRIRVYARAVRRPPPPAPRHLTRLPVHTSTELGHSDQMKLDDQKDRGDQGGHSVEDDVDTVVQRAAAELRRQRYRVLVRGNTVAAERGYLREAGNLLFHVSLLGLLLGVSIGALFAYRGSVVVTVGQGFSNNLTQYDDFSAGAWFRPDTLTPFSLSVAKFDVRFETGPVQRGAARLFRADLDVTDSPNAAPRRTTLEVNQPLRVGNTSVYLIGHGYAPRVTVRDGTGAVAFSGPVVFLPQDGNFTSLGVIKVPDARPQRLAFQGIFVPTSVPGQKPTSAFPDAVLPALYVNAFAGPPAVETGDPESVYTLNTAGMTQLRNPDGSVVAVRLVPGTSFTLPGGQGSIQLDGWTRWVKLQVGDSPGVAVVFGSVAAAVTGLCLSLFIRPRRLWVRVSRRPGMPTLLETGGLDRADARTGLDDEVQHLTAVLSAPHHPPNAKERP